MGTADYCLMIISASEYPTRTPLAPVGSVGIAWAKLKTRIFWVGKFLPISPSLTISITFKNLKIEKVNQERYEKVIVHQAKKFKPF